jgi:hypothetical protein
MLQGRNLVHGRLISTYRSHPSPPSARRNATKDWSPSTSSHTHARHTRKGPDEPRRRLTYYVRSCSPWSKRSHLITHEFDDHSSCRPDVMPRRATCRSFQPEFMRRDITHLGSSTHSTDGSAAYLTRNRISTARHAAFLICSRIIQQRRQEKTGKNISRAKNKNRKGASLQTIRPSNIFGPVSPDRGNQAAARPIRPTRNGENELPPDILRRCLDPSRRVRHGLLRRFIGAACSPALHCFLPPICPSDL